MLDALQNSGFLQCIAIIGCTLIHEDAGAVAAGLFVVEHGLSVFVSLFCLYGGVLAGDIMIFGLGRGARRIPWLRRFVTRSPVERAKAWLDRNLVASVALCRITPGLLFPTFAACGLFGLSFRKFILTTAATALLYTPVMLFLTITLKQTVFRSLGYSGWVILFGLALGLTALGSRWRGPAWFNRLPSPPPQASTPSATEAGLNPAARSLGVAERIPPSLFYLPLALQWLGLAVRYRSLTLPTAANPMIEGGGLWGESKTRCMDMVGPDQRAWLARGFAIARGPTGRVDDDVARTLKAMDASALTFPVVVKPDIGWQGFGVRQVSGPDELRDYLIAFPSDAQLMVQEYVPYEGEAGIFYIREPDAASGHVVSLTLRRHPFVVGDGTSTVRELIQRDPRASVKSRFHLASSRWHAGPGTVCPNRVPAMGEIIRLAFIGSIRVGGLYRDACSMITEALTRRVDAIARSMPEFYYGRFDVRYRSLDALRRGEEFRIIEINGAGAELIHIWDPDMPLRDVFRVLHEGQSRLFALAARNRARGFAPMTLREFAAITRRQHDLIARYPASA